MARPKDTAVFEGGTVSIRASKEAEMMLDALVEFYRDSLSLPVTKAQCLTMIIKKDYLKNFKGAK